MTETKSPARHGQGRGCVITRRACFSASHRYWLPELSADDNAAQFGPCALAPGHGHNYELHVTIKGEPAEETGYCMNLKRLKDIIKERVEDPLDHRNLNLDVPWMKGKKTSTEVLIIAIWEQLEGPIAAEGCTLHQLRLYETENNYADYFGGQ